MARRNEPDGVAGEVTRLRKVYDAVNKTLPVSAPPDVLTESMQTGDRLRYPTTTSHVRVNCVIRVVDSINSFYVMGG